MGVGRATQQPSLLEGAVADLTAITGQKPIVTKAKNSIAGVQAPRGPVDRQQGHAARRPHVGVPRPADRRRHPPHPRLPRPAADSRGTGVATTRSGSTTRPCSPRSTTTRSTSPRGMDITIVTTATTDAAGKALLDAFGFPFQQRRRRRTPPHPRSADAAAGQRPRRQEEEVREGIEMAKKALINKAERQAEVQGARLHPMPSLRPGAFGVPQVRPVPRLPARAGPRRRDPRPDEGELVREDDHAD